MSLRIWLGTAALMVMASTASASVTYNVQIDTSSISLTTGWLDIQFNPGAVSWQEAYADITVFTTDGTLLTSASPLSPELIGDVSGTLPGTLTFHNSTSYNDYFQRLAFGSFIDFSVIFHGPAVDSPDSGFFSGSTFALALYADDMSTALISTAPLFQLDINVGGAIVPTINAPAEVELELVSATVPEPSGLLLCGAALAALAIRRRR